MVQRLFFLKFVCLLTVSFMVSNAYSGDCVVKTALIEVIPSEEGTYSAFGLDIYYGDATNSSNKLSVGINSSIEIPQKVHEKKITGVAFTNRGYLVFREVFLIDSEDVPEVLLKNNLISIRQGHAQEDYATIKSIKNKSGTTEFQNMKLGDLCGKVMYIMQKVSMN